MKSKVTLIFPNDKEQIDIVQADPYESIKFICRLRKIVFETSKIVRIGNEYEYPIRNGNIIHARQIA